MITPPQNTTTTKSLQKVIILINTIVKGIELTIHKRSDYMLHYIISTMPNVNLLDNVFENRLLVINKTMPQAKEPPEQKNLITV